MKKKRWNVIITLNNDLNIDSLINGDINYKKEIIENVLLSEEEIDNMLKNMEGPDELIKLKFYTHKKLFLFAIPKQNFLHIKIERFKDNNFKHLSEEGERIVNE